MKKALILALSAASILTGCESVTKNQTLREIGNAPAMSPIGSGLQFSQAPQLSAYPKQPLHAASGYSLWSDSKARSSRTRERSISATS